MARIDTLANFLTDIANKIRSKTGSQSNITPANYDTEIEKIAFKTKGMITFNPNKMAGTGISIPPDEEITTINIKNIDTSELEIFDHMFRNLYKLTSVNSNDLDTSSAISMENMFQGCKNLTSIDVSSWDTSNVTNLKSVFQGCSSLTELDLSSWDTSNVTNINMMFRNCTNLETITFGNNFTFEKMSGGTPFSALFQGCTKLDNNTLNAILHLCTTVTSAYTGNKTLDKLGISDSFDNYANIPNLSNYQAFLDAGWTIS